MERVTSESISRLLGYKKIDFIEPIIRNHKTLPKNLPRPDSNFSIWKVL